MQEFPLDKIALMVKSPIEQVIEVLVDLLKHEGLSNGEAIEKIEQYKAKFLEPPRPITRERPTPSTAAPSNPDFPQKKYKTDSD